LIVGLTDADVDEVARGEFVKFDGSAETPFLGQRRAMPAPGGGIETGDQTGARVGDEIARGGRPRATAPLGEDFGVGRYFDFEADSLRGMKSRVGGPFLAPVLPWRFSVGAVELFQISKVLRATRGFLCGDEISLGDVVDGKTVPGGNDLVVPRRLEFQTGNRGEEIDFTWSDTHAELGAGTGEIFLSKFKG